MDVEIKPNSDVLNTLGLSEADFNGALADALDRLAEKPVWDLPTPSDISLLLHGEPHRLGDLARIDVSFQPVRRP